MTNSINVSGGSIVVVDGKVIGSSETIIGNGKLTSVNRTCERFNSIQLNGAVDVAYKPGNQCDIKISGDENIVSLIKTSVQARQLQISSEGSYSTKNRIVVTCESPNVDAVFIKGSGDAILENIDTQKLCLRVRGSGDIEADGKVDYLEANVEGSGDIDCSELIANDALLNANGSGDIKAFCSNSVVAITNGSGDIRVKGRPHSISKAEKGSGSIKIK